MNWRWLTIVLLLVPIAGASLWGAQSWFGPPLLYGVRVTPEAIRPDGSEIASQASIQYAVGRQAYVTIAILAPDGTVHTLRDHVLRPPDHYEIPFDGSVPTGTGPNRRLLADGSYLVRIQAVDARGAQAEQEAAVTIAGADKIPLEVTNLVIQPTTITPNGRGENDTAAISYSLSKKAQVTVFATDSSGNYALIQPPAEQEGAAGLPAPWDGKDNGGRLLPDGSYTIHVKAVDKAGNVTEVTQPMRIENGGTPMITITNVKFWPTLVPLNGVLRVEITVKNIGNTVIKSLGPDPGTRYTLNTNYATFRDDKGTPLYYERPGTFRVGVMWSNAPQPYPARWGFGGNLAPGAALTVRGEIVIDSKLPRTGTYFWAGIEQGGVGFLDTNSGQTEIDLAD